MTSYKQTLEYLYSQLPMYQRMGPSAYKDTLENTIRLDQLFEHPHRAFKTIHVAGTNGKGSSSHMLASVLQESGYTVGLYTSPHLIDFRERIRVNGKMISEEEVVSFTETFHKMNETKKMTPSFFEMTVAMAFDHFRRRKVDVAVIEVGLGGRLDSTNIISPEISLITNISLDHTALLGNTIEKIAVEKAGIIKEHVPVIISESNEDYDFVFENKANELNSPIYFADRYFQAAYSMFLPEGKQLFNFNMQGRLVYPDLRLDLLGSYQRKNLSGILKVIELLKNKGWDISQTAIYEGLSKVTTNTGLRGRWEIIGNNPLIICDTAHNEGGLKDIVEQIQATPWKKLYLVLGMVNDKNLDKVMEILPKEAHYIFTQANIPRALPATELRNIASGFGLVGTAIDNVRSAAVSAQQLAGSHDFIFIGGSTFVVADYFSENKP